MTYHERTVLVVVLVTTCLFDVCAGQTRGPISAKTYDAPDPIVAPEVEAAVPIEPAKVKPAPWPVRLGRRLFSRDDGSESETPDPFLGEGLQQQQQLAVELAGGGARQTGAPGARAPSNLYPWPSPIDSQTMPTNVANGTTWTEGVDPSQQSNGSAAPSGSRIVDAVRQANARALKRLGGAAPTGPNAVAVNRSALTPAQPAMNADAVNGDYAQAAVTKYLQRVSEQGTANGQLFNPLAESPQVAQQPVQQSVQAVQAMANNLPGQAVQQFHQQVQSVGGMVARTQQAANATLQQMAPVGGAMTQHPVTQVMAQQPIPQAPTGYPTFTGQPPQGITPPQVSPTNTAGLVQPMTQYVPNMPQASTAAPPTGGQMMVAPQGVGPVPGYVASGAPAPGSSFATNSPPTQVAQTIPSSSQMPSFPANPSPQNADPNIWGTPLHNKPELSRASEFPGGTVQTTSATSTSPSFPTAPDLPVNQSIASEPIATIPSAVTPLNVTPPTASAPAGLGTQDKNARVLAIVGDQSILAGDVLSQVEQMMEPYRSQMTEDQYEEQSELVIQKLLPRLVENKLVFLDFLRTVPPDKLPELEAKVFEFFSEKQLPEMREKLGAETTAEVDAKLRELGSSLAKQQKLFLEKFVGQESVRRNVNVSAEITHDELLEYFHAHKDEFSFPTRARWERLSVEIVNFDSREAAHDALAKMGNAVMQGGDFSEIAKNGSQGPRADEGGQYDWTTEGSLRSKTVSDLVFTLPEGKLSRIIEADGSLHIIRVVERQEAGVEEFAEVQNKISDKIKELRFKEGAEEYLERLKRETYVWTVYDDAATTVAAPPMSFGGSSFTR